MDYEVEAGVGPNRVVVVGAGKSGLAVARFCASRNAAVTITDTQGPSALAKVMRDPELRGVSWELGGHREETFTSADLVVISPGVPEIPEVKAAREKGVHVTGEIELASRFIQAPIVAITGTNGKSTVTALCGEIAKHTGRPTFVGGNLGTPLITCVGTPAATVKGIVVVELSSFQLETCETLKPKAAALLNLTPDHLDRYDSLEAYGAAKLRIAQRMGNDTVLVINADDAFFTEAVKPLANYVPIERYAARAATGVQGSVDGNDLLYLLEGGEERYPIAELNLIGRHNLGNALAAIVLMRSSGLASYAQVRAGLKAFLPLPHRMQLVGELDGVRYYDDSKATNVDSVVAGIDGFPRPFVLIAGGRHKGGSYAPMVEAMVANRCRAAILIGEAAYKIDAAIGGRVPTVHCKTLEEAVAEAGKRAQPGDAVVLSPACSSYDMFENYEHRGRAFKAAVEAL
jgi:UDP-N-acetylmuramoylalanine--D-glutamate ligase